MTDWWQMSRRVVWVLGAGFSAALGGPMLGDLFSRRSEKDTALRFPEHAFPRLHGPPAPSVRLLYQRGLADGLMQLSNRREVMCERMWSNAEDFIDYIDTTAAACGKDANHWLGSRIDEALTQLDCQRVRPDQLRDLARRLVAAECCGFLHRVSTEREQWKPFHRWARNLIAKGDTIVSFNYDRVVELIREAHTKETNDDGASPIRVLVPSSAGDDWNAACPMLKLHGSVDWLKGLDGKSQERVIMEHKQDPTCALTCDDDQLAIATPGPSKQAVSDSDFLPLWTEAKKRLKVADAIVFVGYRFPETDAHAREELLGAIRENHADDGGSHHLSLHIVLGHPGRDSIRLEALLRFAAGAHRQEGGPSNPGLTFDLNTYPLFAQDFFTVVQRKHLFWHRR